MKTPHRFAALAAATLIAGALAGCAADAADPGGTGDGAAGEAADRSIAFISGANNEWGSCLQGGVEAAASDAGVELLTANSDADAAKELANVEDMISRGVDAILLNTVSVDALQGGIQKAAAAGVPLYLIAVVPEDTSEILGATVVDLAGAGALAAGWIAEDAAGAEVAVGVIAGAPGASSDYVVAGFEGALPASATIVANQPGMFNRAAAQGVAENMIQAEPDLDYVFVLNEDMAFGARTAFDAAGREDLVIVTMNGTEPGLAAIEEGKFAATVSDSASNLGATAVTNALALLDDDSAEKISQVQISLITPDNLDGAVPFCG
ncbi:sugar ABC transporter substrate-binding protein [Microbacterium sp. zg-YB36]|uniref:sugar ABC transporter substrate-binding protein n=1 Tax=Microbacterium sp. zg-YB36 TaxID=2969407 RepID=UPI00214B3C35|nr:sugar ABC transporter substrate-binding protein [Microbacterium sp. zg-YB36]MDL5351756.1 sugar ABC transporter substrate-binding protein [Microbacterium sp. zg-YB36]